MKISDFAEQILFGESLSDKLVAPPELTDEPLPRARRAPTTPGRPLELRFAAASRGEAAEGRQVFPRSHELEDPRSRGAAMHFFASHELLALELMALVLLRFPEAPKAFRRGLAQTMRDEQRHLTLYLQHMSRLGVEFGSLPLGGYFWNSLSGVESLLDFVTQMSLTFEQANLDFALFFAQRFLEVGDAESADVMQQIFEDEVRHVRHGLTWFREWKPSEETDWQCFASRLAYPLSPSRAKGLGFSVDARRRVGFDDEFIERLELFRQTKGRVPRIYLYNAAQEFEVGAPGLSYQQSGLLSDIAEDLEFLMIHLTCPDDVVALRRQPSRDLLKRLMGAGFEFPEFVSFLDKDREVTWDARRKFAAIVPWGMSPRVQAIERKLRDHAGLPAVGDAGFERHLKGCVSKSFAARLREPLTRSLLGQVSGSASTSVLAPLVRALEATTEGDGFDAHASAIHVISSEEELMQRLTQWGTRGVANVILKSPFGSSGHNQLRIRTAALRAEDHFWIRKVLNVHREIIAEPLRRIEVEFSCQMNVLEGGQLQECGVVRNLAAPNGQYVGSAVGKNLWGLSPEVRQFIYTVDYPRVIQEMGRRVGVELAQLGYVGPFGIDTYIFRNAEGNLDVNLLGEINLRFTMGRIASELRKRCHAGRSVIMTLVPAHTWKGLMGVLPQEVEPSFHEGNDGDNGRDGGPPSGTLPLGFKPSLSRRSGLIEEGFFPLADESRARRLIPALWVGREDQAESMFRLLTSQSGL